VLTQRLFRMLAASHRSTSNDLHWRRIRYKLSPPMANERSDFASAALRHIRDAEHLISAGANVVASSRSSSMARWR
jgi:hypothetical protein